MSSRMCKERPIQLSSQRHFRPGIFEKTKKPFGVKMIKTPLPYWELLYAIVSHRLPSSPIHLHLVSWSCRDLFATRPRRAGQSRQLRSCCRRRSRSSSHSHSSFSVGTQFLKISLVFFFSQPAKSTSLHWRLRCAGVLCSSGPGSSSLFATSDPPSTPLPSSLAAICLRLDCVERGSFRVFQGAPTAISSQLLSISRVGSTLFLRILADFSQQLKEVRYRPLSYDARS